MTLEFIPLKQFSQRISEGWTLATTLSPGDYAACMRPPEFPKPNRSRAAIHRNKVTAENGKARKLADLAAWGEQP